MSIACSFPTPPVARRPFAVALLHDALRTSWVLFRVMLPMALLTRLLQQLGWIEPIGRALAPLMRLVGLPGEMALAWAAAMLTNMYGGLATYLQLTATTPLNVAQTTVLMVLILEAHTLPVEALVARQAGARLRFTLPWRIGGALLLGALLNLLYRAGGWLQAPAAATLALPALNLSWGAWALVQLRSILFIFLLITLLLALLEGLKRTGGTRWLARLLSPLLRLLGIGGEAAPLAVIGLVLGLGYGGGLIVREARAGHIGQRDAFLALALLGLDHSLIEDTLLVAAMGAHSSGILWLRFLFAAAAVALLSRLLRRYPALLPRLATRPSTPRPQTP